MFKQEVPSIRLSLEQGTPAVPRNGKFYVLINGSPVFNTRSRTKALSVYRREMERLFEIHGRPDPPLWDRDKWLQEQRTQDDIRAMRAEWLRTHGPKLHRKGGKGGKGGV